MSRFGPLNPLFFASDRHTAHHMRRSRRIFWRKHYILTVQTTYWR